MCVLYGRPGGDLRNARRLMSLRCSSDRPPATIHDGTTTKAETPLTGADSRDGGAYRRNRLAKIAN